MILDLPSSPTTPSNGSGWGSQPSSPTSRRPSLRERRKTNLEAMLAWEVPGRTSKWWPPHLVPGPQLGRGSSSEVVEATDTVRNRKVAVKTAWVNSSEMREILRDEYKILVALRHPHVVAALDFIEEGSESSARPLLVLQRAKGPSLSTLLSQSPLEEKVAKIFAKQLCDTLAYIHSAGVVHRDVKPDNIIIEKIAGASLEMASIVLIDFNVAREHESDETGMLTVTGTPEYRAPEVSNQWGYSSKVDIWGLGMTTFAMITGGIGSGYIQPAFSCEPLHLATKEELLHHINPDFSGPRWEATTVNCRAFVIASHQILSALRPSAARLLKHPWFTEETRRGADGSDARPNAAQRRFRRTNTTIDDETDDGGELGGANQEPIVIRRATIKLQKQATL
jgi:serine/threonine protein kinase